MFKLKRDNGSYREKAQLRRQALKLLANCPLVVLETHGGFGKLGAALYLGAETGCVFDLDAKKCDSLLAHRPNWSVYQADCIKALAGGAGSHLAFTFLDCDPYGSPWDVLTAFFSSERKFADYMQVVVTDGLLVTLKQGGAASVKCLREEVDSLGSQGVLADYQGVCRRKLAGIAAVAGYSMETWAVTSAGHVKQMTLYACGLRMTGERAAPIGRLDDLGKRAGSEHRAYLNSAAWLARRAARLKQAAGACEECGARPKVLHVHHLTYESLGAERPEDLAVWCPSCHARHHKGGQASMGRDAGAAGMR